MITLLLATVLQHPAQAPPPETFEAAVQEPGLPAREDLRHPAERHFGTIRRLTNAGENAEGYFSFGGDRLVYQATVGGRKCDQIYTLDLLSGARRLVSTGTGRTTCAYFLPGDREILFASTHASGSGCLTPPDYSQGYVWKIYPEYDIWIRDLDSWALRPLAHSPGYDAEATVSPDGRRIVFTSTRNGDLDVYTMNVDGSEVRQLTDRLGYDGGPFFSPDSRQIVWRASYPQTEAAQEHYRRLLAEDSVEPRTLEIWIMDADGGHKRQITANGAANFAPYFHPAGERIIYCSNQHNPRGRNFDLFMVGTDGTDNERITYNPSFDGFPMFSTDGRRLVFASNRAGATPGNTNLFLAEWLEESGPAASSR